MALNRYGGTEDPMGTLVTLTIPSEVQASESALPNSTQLCQSRVTEPGAPPSGTHMAVLLPPEVRKLTAAWDPEVGGRPPPASTALQTRGDPLVLF